MRAKVTDDAALASLNPVEVASYLRGTGWISQDWINARARLWIRQGDGGRGLLLPTERQVADYAIRMGDLVERLAQSEDRSELEVLSDLQTSGVDVVRVRAQPEHATDNSIPLDDGVEMVKAAREMLLAAASSTVQRRPYFPRRRPSEAVEYIQRVRLGQTEPGSYVVRLLSPVAPGFSTAGQGDMALDQPFERRAIRTLLHSLEAAKDAAEAAVQTGSFDRFTAVVEEGVNANLCDALTTLTATHDLSSLQVAVSWSSSRPPSNAEESNQVGIAAELSPVFAEASRYFKEVLPIEMFDLSGYVVRLDHMPNEAGGRISVLTVMDDRQRSVTVDLPEPEYDRAVAAHSQDKPIRMVGRLVREGGRHVLADAQGLEILEVDSLGLT
jgi:hypothetical protein